MSVSINRDEWLKALDEAGLSVTDDQDAISVQEFADMCGLARQTAGRRLEMLVEQGKAVRTQKRGRVASTNRIVHLVAYRLIQESKKKGRKH